MSTDQEAIGLLGGFSMTRQEAAVYCRLLSDGEMNGYEMAKQLSISRSNAYTALAGLVEKGAAWIAEGVPVRYSAVPPQEFCQTRLDQLEKTKQRLLEVLPKRRTGEGSYITLRGREKIMARLRTLLSEARERVYLSLHGKVLAEIDEQLSLVIEKGLKLVVITDPETIKHLKARYPAGNLQVYSGKVTETQIRAIADSHFVLTGDIAGGEICTCLFSDQKHLVDIFKTALGNEIRLIELEDQK